LLRRKLLGLMCQASMAMTDPKSWQAKRGNLGKGIS
jgi:hypothetical protein